LTKTLGRRGDVFAREVLPFFRDDFILTGHLAKPLDLPEKHRRMQSGGYFRDTAAQAQTVLLETIRFPGFHFRSLSLIP
jgi:hypothetical protein